MLLLVLKKVLRTQTNNQNAVFCESRLFCQSTTPQIFHGVLNTSLALLM